ncbi:MAG: DUF5666 domain-containing protein [Gammaproteobacteria bacterium]|jgi:hypothetical protein|nr:DUF5666 domain-containing protein [Gammaproteobacteria bacterium]
MLLMTRTRLNLARLAVVAASATLAACGGGGGADGVSTAGIDRLGIVTGPVTGFGSVIVNGITYNTDTATFNVDENPDAQQSDLRLGDIVVLTVDPDLAPTRALQVLSQAALEGPVQSVDVPAGRLLIAGQTVRVTPATLIDTAAGGGSLAGIQVGEFLEVHGFADAEGALRATRIDVGGGDVEVSGVLSNLDTVARTFSIGALVVDYGAVPAEIEGFAGGELTNGALVEAEGTLNGAGVLLADEVEANDLQGRGIDFDDFDEVDGDLVGLITRFVSPADFDVAGFPVRTNAGTEFDNGSAADLALNVRVEVEGTINAAGVLVADEVEFADAIDLVVAGQVDQDPAASQVVVLGIEFTVAASTLIEDQSSAAVPALQLGQINTGDYLEIVAAEAGAARVARVIKRKDLPGDPGEDTEITGRVAQVSLPTFVIAGVTIVTAGGTEYEDPDGDEVGQAAFFNLLSAGDTVEVSGFEASQTVLEAEEVEFAELDDD